jgi:glycosyltransferase involved in cell wall biosynthesis
VRILNVIGSVDRRGGGTTDHVFSCSQLWAQAGHDCHILCLDAPTDACVLGAPVPTIALGRKGFLRSIQRFLLPLRYGYEPNFGRWLRRHGAEYDAIILNGLWNYTSFGTWLAIKKLNVPYYVCPHGMLDPWLKSASPMRHLLRLVFWQLAEKRVLREARAVIFACEEEKRLACCAFLQDTGNSYVIPYGTKDVRGDPVSQKRAFFSRFDELQSRKLILFLGRIHPKKGIDLLIEAFALTANEFPEHDLLIAGPDDVGLVTNLSEAARELGIAHRVHWAGMLEGEEKWGAFRAAEFFVLPSHQENFGIAVAEAMALAVPVLITDKVNIWREVQSSGGAYVVTDSIDGIAEGLRAMCSLKIVERERMGQTARSYFVKHFDLEKNAAELLRLIGLLNVTGIKNHCLVNITGSATRGENLQL